MKKKPSEKPKEKKKPSQSQIDIGGDVNRSNIVMGDNNVINLSAKQIFLRSLYQLPPAPADFTGRETLVDDLLKDFDSHKGAAISGLTGMGGIGKTALGLVIANQLKEKYTDAQIFLDLKGTTTPLTALDIVRHVILSFEPSTDLRVLNETNMSAAYQSILHNKRVLLYFDNARSGEQIAPLIPPDSCSLIVTSRWNFAVKGLKNHKVGVLDENEAVNFLLEVCPRIREYAKVLAKACAYLPLALRIAGGFLQVNNNWGIEKYITQLSDRKKRLTTLSESRENAELTAESDLFATFELSYHQLSEDNQKRWRVLGVFPVSFDSGATQAIWELEGKETINLLSLLKRYGLIEFDETSSRYSLHDLLMDYANSQMDGSEQQASREKHAAHYMNVMVAANSLYSKGNDNILQGLHLLDLEWEHICIGQTWAVENIEIKNAQILSNEYPNAGFRILSFRLHPKVYIQWLENGLEAARLLKDKKYESYHLVNLGSAYSSLSLIHEAIDVLEKARMITQEIRDRKGEGAILINLGICYDLLGKARESIQCFEKSFIIAKETKDDHSEALALTNLGFSYLNLGNIEGAVPNFKESLRIANISGDLDTASVNLRNLGTAYLLLKDTHTAIDFYNESLSIARKIGDKSGEGMALQGLGDSYMAISNVQKAVDYYTKALDVASKIDNRQIESNVVGHLGNAYLMAGNISKAIDFYRRQIVIAREIGDRRGEGNALSNLGNALHSAGEKEKGINLVQQALAIFEEIESPYVEQAQNMLKEWGVLK